MDSIKILGEFSMNIFCSENGEKKLIESYTDENLVVQTGKNCLCKLISDSSLIGYQINSIAFGTGINIPDVDDVDLTPGYFIKPIENFTQNDQHEIFFNWELLTTENNGMAISEYGLYTDGGFLFARKIRSVIDKKANLLFEGDWKIKFV